VGASEVACCVMLLLWLLGRGLLEDEEEEEDEEPASAPARLASRSFGTCLLASSICCAIMLPAPPRPQGMMIGYEVGLGSVLESMGLGYWNKGSRLVAIPIERAVSTFRVQN